MVRCGHMRCSTKQAEVSAPLPPSQGKPPPSAPPAVTCSLGNLSTMSSIDVSPLQETSSHTISAGSSRMWNSTRSMPCSVSRWLLHRRTELEL